MSSLTEAILRSAVAAVHDPATGQSLLDLGIAKGFVLQEGKVGCTLEFPRADYPGAENLRQEVEAALLMVPGVTHAMVLLTAHRQPPPAVGAGLKPRPLHAPSRPAPTEKLHLPGIRRLLAVASGKGGVGKSTTAVNLAIAFSQSGLSVGMLDADIYGPSLPMMLGITDKPRLNAQKQMVPVEKFGLQVLSIGLLTDNNQPVIWRGPMVMGAIEQMLRDAAWNAIDVLVIDLPPGTGDAQMTLAQRVPVSGAVVVSTPQDIALLDARKGFKMFEKMGVPVWGMIENMSTFCCPACGTQTAIFGHGGAEKEAEALGIPFLGGVPLALPVREAGDSGQPLAFHSPALAAPYAAMAARLRETMGI
jgi:ATP-binding protein involved in chromosome partitioning